MHHSPLLPDTRTTRLIIFFCHISPPIVNFSIIFISNQTIFLVIELGSVWPCAAGPRVKRWLRPSRPSDAQANTFNCVQAFNLKILRHSVMSTKIPFDDTKFCRFGFCTFVAKCYSQNVCTFSCNFFETEKQNLFGCMIGTNWILAKICTADSCLSQNP